MNEINSYLYNQSTRDKYRKNDDKKEDISNRNYLNNNKRNNFQSPFLSANNQNDLIIYLTKNKKLTKNQVNSTNNKINISEKFNHKYFYSSMNINNISTKNQNNNISKNEVNNHNFDIQLYNNSPKKKKYQRCNSLAYIKKRPNDLIKIQIGDNKINNKFSKDENKIKVRCLSCSNMRIPKNNDIGEKNINTSRNVFVPLSYSFATKNGIKERNILNFSVKKQNKILNKNVFCKSIFKVIKNHLLSKKIIFLKNIKIKKPELMYEVTLEEYKFLEDLKALGVTNKNELNSLLKDIYISIKGNEK